MKARSSTTADRDRYYSRIRAVWLPGKVCEAAGILEGCQGQATDVHHMKGRGRFVMLDVETWAALCRSCHGFVTVNPARGRELGLLFRENEETGKMESYSRCRSCARPIYWAKTEDGKSIPLIADPDLRRPMQFPDEGKAGRIQQTAAISDLFGETTGLLVVVLGKGVAADPAVPIWRTHFSDCPQSAEWRK